MVRHTGLGGFACGQISLGGRRSPAPTNTITEASAPASLRLENQGRGRPSQPARRHAADSSLLQPLSRAVTSARGLPGRLGRRGLAGSSSRSA